MKIAKMGAAVGALFVCVACAHRSNRIFYAPNEYDFTFHRLGYKAASCADLHICECCHYEF